MTDAPAADSTKHRQLVQMRVTSLTFDPLSGVPLVLLRDPQGKRELAVWVGKTEAAAIATQLERIQLDRPSTHDLMRNLLVTVGAFVERAEIHDVVDETFYATLFVRGPGQAVAIAVDARPSDALALALRCGAPIFVAEKVLVQQADPMFSESTAPVGVPLLHLASVADLTKWRM